jgi:hypothetical protein
MRELLVRLQNALPAVEAWISDLHRRHAAESVSADATGCTRLADYLPRSVLQQARAVLVDRVPFPPVGAMGLPEFEAMAAMPIAGITFGHMYFLDRSQATEAIHLHELVHVVQWGTLGVPAFLSAYGVGIVRHGYEASPFETAAFDMQDHFERGEPIPDLTGLVSAHAERIYAETEELFRSVGLTMSRRTRK